MFVECKRVKDIWHSIEEYIFITINFTFKFSYFDILFGCLLINQNKTPVNAIILITKKYIYDIISKSNIGSSYNLEALKYRFQQTYQDEMFLATLMDRKETFDNVWSTWIPVFSVT